MRALTWHILIPRIGTGQQETYRLDGDYNPVRAWLHFDVAPTGAETIVDINVDGLSIFAYRPRAMDDKDVVEDGFSKVQLTKDSLVSLDIDQVGKEPGRDLTVGLELEEA